VPAIGPAKPAKLHAPWGSLPPRIKVLYITTLHHQRRSLTEAFAVDSAVEVVLEESIGVTAGMARLREEVFDAVLAAHEPGVLDALELIEGLRASGTEEPVIVLGSQSEAEMAALCFEVGADGYCCFATTTTRSLIWTVARAMERHQLIRENRQLVQADRQRLAYEHQEAERLLAQQRSLIDDLQQFKVGRTDKDGEGADETLGEQPDTDRTLPPPLPVRLVNHYRDMLRAYVIMGSGNLTEEMSRLADLLATAEVTARQTMQLHIQVLEELIQGLGNRSARHVMNRADLLVLEVMIHLCDSYRQSFLRRVRPPQQLALPGFDAQASDTGSKTLAKRAG